MAMQTDVQSEHYTGAAATMYTGRTRLRGIIFLGGGTAGDIVFRDGGSTGDIKMQFNIPANSNNDVGFTLPGEGIIFTTSIYVQMPGTTSSMTIFYG